MNSNKFSKGFSLTEEIENILRERILIGEYGIGERIKESLVADELKVSRTPIREAFKQLEEEGLIKTLPNRGSFALGLTREDIQDIYAVRTAVEALAIEWAVNRISDEEIEKLQDVYERMEFYSAKQDSKRVLDLNKDFHRIIYNASGSRFLAQILKSYQEFVEKTRKATVYNKENLGTILFEHGQILESIQAKDGKRAVENIVTHLTNSRKRTENSLLL
jgi:DNA-binding GntR family transcriptional regulator